MKNTQITSISLVLLFLCTLLSGCGTSKGDIRDAQGAVKIFEESENVHFIMTSKPEGQSIANTWEYWCDNTEEKKYYLLQTSYDEAGKERYRTGQLVMDGKVYTNMSNMLEEKGKWEKEMNSVLSAYATETSPTQVFETAFLSQEGKYKSTSRKSLKDGTTLITLIHGKEALEERNKKILEDPGAGNPMEYQYFAFQVVMNQERQPEYFQEEYTIYREEHGEIKDSIKIELKAMNDDKVLQELEELIQEAGIEQ